MDVLDEKARREIGKYLDLHFPKDGRARLITFSPEKEESDCEYCIQVKELAQELASISGGRITAEHRSLSFARGISDGFRVRRVPATVVTDTEGKYSMKFYGVPSGHEFAALLEDLVDAARGDGPQLNEETVKFLLSLNTPVHLQVFVTPSCPYCPRAVRTAHQFSMVNPKLIDAEMIESMEFPELVDRYSVMAVPKVVINDDVQFEGALPEKVFLFKVKEAVQRENTDAGGKVAESALSDKVQVERAD